MMLAAIIFFIFILDAGVCQQAQRPGSVTNETGPSYGLRPVVKLP